MTDGWNLQILLQARSSHHGIASHGRARIVRHVEHIGARFGYGLQGVLTTTMDGQLWAQASLVSDPAQLDASCPGCPGGVRSNQALPRVPARSALKLAFRMPYYVLPFDLILLAPITLLISKEAAQDVVFKATGGGLWTLQRPISTSFGTFQFMAGR